MSEELQALPADFTGSKRDARPLPPQGEEALLRKPSAAAKPPRLRSLGLRSIPTGRKQMAEAKAVFLSGRLRVLVKEDQKGSISKADGSKQSAGLPLVDLAGFDLLSASDLPAASDLPSASRRRRSLTPSQSWL